MRMYVVAFHNYVGQRKGLTNWNFWLVRVPELVQRLSVSVCMSRARPQGIENLSRPNSYVYYLGDMIECHCSLHGGNGLSDMLTALLLPSQ